MSKRFRWITTTLYDISAVDIIWIESKYSQFVVLWCLRHSTRYLNRCKHNLEMGYLHIFLNLDSYKLTGLHRIVMLWRQNALTTFHIKIMFLISAHVYIFYISFFFIINDPTLHLYGGQIENANLELINLHIRATKFNFLSQVFRIINFILLEIFNNFKMTRVCWNFSIFILCPCLTTLYIINI